MRIQVNSDKTIAVDASMTRFVETEVSRALRRFGTKLTRAEVHLSDVDNRKTGQADKRCLIEARPAGARPLSASARATKLAPAIREAAGKMQRSLTTFFGRRGRVAATSAAVSPAKKTPAGKSNVDSKKGGPAKKTAAKEPAKPSPRGPKKKGIYQARRKSWPAK